MIAKKRQDKNPKVNHINVHGKRLSKPIKTAAALAAVFFFSTGCAEQGPIGNAKVGESKSAICAQCHGANGISIVPIYPNLAGQKEQYMVLALKAYRSGERVNMAMTPHARKLSDEDIADLSAYYASLPPGGN